MQKNISKIDYVLNLFEHISIGIKNNIYDEEIIKQSFYTMMIHVWGISETYIEQLNKDGINDTAFQEYRYVVDRWKKIQLGNNTRLTNPP